MKCSTCRQPSRTVEYTAEHSYSHYTTERQPKRRTATSIVLWIPLYNRDGRIETSSVYICESTDYPIPILLYHQNIQDKADHWSFLLPDEPKKEERMDLRNHPSYKKHASWSGQTIQRHLNSISYDSSCRSIYRYLNFSGKEIFNSPNLFIN